MQRLRRILAFTAGGLVALLILGGVLVATWPPFARWLLGIETVRAEVSAFPLAAPAFDHALLDHVLETHVHDGYVDYSAIASDPSALRRYMAQLATSGPQTTPARFPTEAFRTAWTINAYNAAVLLGVIDHWPIRSVREVHGLIEPKPGFGFFWAQRFVLDGRQTNLIDLESELRRRTGDARVHAALNCASVGCPDLRAAAWAADTLDEDLDRAARRLASEPRHVQVDDAGEAIVLSQIYQWYAADFERDARQRGLGIEVLDWIAHFADDETADALARARSAGYAVRYRPYDWGLNGT
ncbi:MAG: DUF547 domain-containing protein [Deltaproteobacteria bacterium]|nr:DUF547 domain-containing protein [Deltaproteobacteria bacterium]